MTQSEPKPPLVNCHTHIFTGDHVPAYLARSIVPAPLHRLFNVQRLLSIFRWYKDRTKFRYKPRYRNLIVRWRSFRSFLVRTRLVWLVVNLLLFVATGQVLLHALVWFNAGRATDDQVMPCAMTCADRLAELGLFNAALARWQKVALLLVVLLLWKPGRRALFQLARLFWPILRSLPGAQLRELLSRYMLIVKFSMYDSGKRERAGDRVGQRLIFEKLVKQYPKDTEFVVLPMDMEHMGAGPVAERGEYGAQLEDLVVIKTRSKYRHQLRPFIFIDPRRTGVKGSTAPFIACDLTDAGEVRLDPECIVGEYVLKHGFRGFKIYPALGYHVFDEGLLPLWLYAAQKGIPIMSHCVKGVIYYRGHKRREWDHHPIFLRRSGTDAARLALREPLDLLEPGNEQFSWNFTHPLNLLCLLSEPLLRVLVGRAAQNVKNLYGYNGPGAPMDRDLRHLKFCFAHFGGDDEWKRHLESDSNDLNQALMTRPATGAYLGVLPDGTIDHGRLENLWRNADWYTIICSLMLQFPNVYADVSYILHDPAVRPLLIRALEHPGGKLAERILFGTDFYVVRNHRSEKELLSEMMAGLPAAHFDRMARYNPRTYLN